MNYTKHHFFCLIYFNIYLCTFKFVPMSTQYFETASRFSFKLVEPFLAQKENVVLSSSYL